MKQQIIKINMIYNAKGEGNAVQITRGSFYLDHTTRTYKYNEMSDAQQNIQITLANRDKWTSFFYKFNISAYPAHFMLMENDLCRAAGTLSHCKRFFKPGFHIIRRTSYPKLPPMKG